MRGVMRVLTVIAPSNRCIDTFLRFGLIRGEWPVRAVAPTLVLLVVSSTASAQPPARNEPQTVAMVHVYRDHFEYGNSTFDTIDQLREVLRGSSIGYSVRECGAEDKLRELVALITENSGGHPINMLRERFDLKCE
jgi:hypothetical protein